MTWYRVKIYQTDDGDAEWLLADEYVQATCAGDAALAMAQKRADEGLMGALRASLGGSQLSTRTQGVD